MTYNTIKNIAYIYILLPLMIFFTLWLNINASIFYTFCLGLIFYFVIKRDSSDESFFLSQKVLKCVVLISFLWVFFSGIGGYWLQSDDFSARNAIYRDLISYAWPVYYSEQNRVLNYYFGFWLVPALFTKLFAGMFDFHELFFFGNQILMLWTIFGVFIFLSLLIYAVRPQKTHQIVLCLVFPIVFSGLDVIASYVFDKYNPQHLEWWTVIQYSCLTTQLFWVFNQALIAWIATLLLITDKKRLENTGVIFIASLFCAPFPTIGLAVFMLVYALRDVCCLYKYHKVHLYQIGKKIFSYQNICAALCLPLLYFFFSISTRVNEQPLALFSFPLKKYIPFWFFEFGLYLLLIFRYFRKDIIFYAIGISLSLLCLFKLGSDFDFQMRASIPAIVLMMIYVLKYINFTPKSYMKIILIILLIIASVTPFYEFRRGFLRIQETKTIFNVHDAFFTLADKDISEFPFFNFLVEDPEEKIFYKYFSKELH